MTGTGPLRRAAATALAALIATLLALLLAACGGGDGEESTSTGATPPQTETRTGTAPPSEGLQIGLQDDQLADPNVEEVPRMEAVAELGAKVLRVDMRWWEVAPTRPQDPRDPNDPAYQWQHNDEVVQAARDRGIEVVFTVWGTPEWAARKGETINDQFPFWGVAPANPKDLGDFAAAAAARYAPMGVHKWEAWNEPNNPLFLRPQYVRRGNAWAAQSPEIYAEMLTAFHDGVKDSDPAAIVAGGVTAPAGPASPSRCSTMPECRIKPDDFLRQVTGQTPQPRMDLWSHHPYPLRKPSDDNFEGASYIDLYNLDRLVEAIDDTYLKDTPIWLTEFGFATEPRPQYSFAVTEEEQARFLVDAVRRVRANPRIEMFIWYFMRDTVAWASGLQREDGSPKPAAAEFRRLAAG